MIKVFKNAVDLSVDSSTYTRDFFDLELLSTDKLYIVHRKPINAIFLGILTPNTNTSVLSVKYFNGTSYTDVSELVDESKGASRSGFFSWSKDNDDEAETSVNSVTGYVYEITVDADTSTMNVKGINLLFSDDAMILESEPQLLNGDFYLEGLTDHIPFHQSARNEIIQRLRNEGYKIEGTKTYDITIFDFHNYKQLSEAAKNLAIAKAFFNISDQAEGKYYQKFLDYSDMYEKSFTNFLSIDVDDDGKEDVKENKSSDAITTGTFERY